MKIRRILVANRGEIALRVIRTCKALGIETVLAASEADLDSLPARLADRTLCIGPARTSQSYLQAGAIVQAALSTRADAIHPGYGFLSERASFSGLCEKNGIVFIGPTPAQIDTAGDKVRSRTAGSVALGTSCKIALSSEGVKGALYGGGGATSLGPAGAPMPRFAASIASTPSHAGPQRCGSKARENLMRDTGRQVARHTHQRAEWMRRLRDQDRSARSGPHFKPAMSLGGLASGYCAPISAAIVPLRRAANTCSAISVRSCGSSM